ncbi:hypothetical protein LTR91_011596 [Friedmanniomyces endolithicus]|uniref:Enoyl reductase (ER) domain-containing protein n=1 Tax=Friedmanniomyces endolithicus TaxID=329885 RepID=A0A4U0UQ01_9PEZI|nr:hypothetical protein LTS09_010093 [Friedmanniomyces endolithicus]KAK0308099.1 hypothetical protein LTR01_005432 [Friedmanniomyces endolithicus]KAK0318622.1 hypothetical protein LTR82_010364 [Friedmanniomyces endolithicus]KAK0831541.1 hypothetical protein LTR73_002924 [Friedmanniomyces endolithicus]KAK0915906.1 hypothetical protein LTR57_013225 [Friedmanniomyces endolithicus]
MRAARYHGPSDIRLDTIPEPTPTATQVLVAIEWGGICGSDLHEYIQGPVVIPTASHPHALTGESLPVVLCHEFCGRVAALPESSSDGEVKGAGGVVLRVGMKVMVDPRQNCQACTSCCEMKSSNICPKWGFLGLTGGGGGFAERCAVRADMCYPLPESVDLADAALIEPLAVGRRALTQSGVLGGEWREKAVLVLGGGPIGVAVVWNLKAFGAERVFLSEPTALRQRQCRGLVERVFDPRTERVAEECRELTGGEGVDVVIDCAGVGPAMRDGMDALRRKGTYVNVAGWETPFQLPMQYFMMKELVVRCTLAYDDADFTDTVADFIAGKYKGAEKMVTSRIAIEDIKEKGFEQLVKNKDAHIKILATPKRELLE